MTVPPSTTNNEIFTALERMEDKLTTALNTGLGAVNLAITSLANAHHQALLDQERRNSSFADRDRVEQIASHVHTNGNEIMTLTKRSADLESMIESRHTLFTANTIGYLVTIGAILLSAIIAYLLAHHT